MVTEATPTIWKGEVAGWPDVMTVYEVDSDDVIVNYGTLRKSDIHFNNGKYTETELNALTKAEILDLALNLGYEMTTTESNTKAEIIAEFLTLQG